MKITSFGDTAAMAPTAMAIAAWLVVGRMRRMAACWCLLFGAGAGLVLATKMAFVGWGLGVRSLDFTGFSGHSMCATAIIPVLFYLLLQVARPVARSAGVLLGIAFGVTVGVSRLALHAHSVSEIVAGCLLGGAVGLCFISVLARSQRIVPYRPLMALGLLMLLSAPYAEPAPTQGWIITMALRLSDRDKPFVRSDWKSAPIALNEKDLRY